MLKSYVLDPRIQEDLKKPVFEPRTLDLQCRSVTLDPIQLHLSPIPAPVPITLAPIDIDIEESGADDLEPQLDQGVPAPEEDPADVPTQLL